MEPVDTLTIVQSAARLDDPHVLSDFRDRRSLLGAIFEALVQPDEHGDYAPLLAERWECAADARTWTFTLHDGVRFHHGEPLRAADVVASLEHAIDPATGGELGTQGVYRSYLAGGAITAIDDRTVRIITPAPLADLLDLLTDIPVAPAHACSRLVEEPVGSGPYCVESVAPGEVTMRAFDDYRGALPPARRLVWRGEPDAARRVAALADGSADIVADVPPGHRAELAAQGYLLAERPASLCVIFMCNCFSGPCADARVRQALNYALDIDALIAAASPGARPLNGPLTPLHLGYDPATPAYPHDPARARALLADAGYGSGLTLTMDVPAIHPDEAPLLAELMAAYYAQVGVHIEVRQHEDRPAYADMVRARRFGDLCCFDSSPMSSYRVLREKIDSRLPGPWWEGYHNAAVNALIDEAAATLDRGARMASYRRAYRLIRDDAPWVFLYHPTLAWGIGPRARGWQPSRDGRIRVR